MRPLFPYYGSKWRTARRYPPPGSGPVIEPFAGSAGYATYCGSERAVLYDIDEYVAGVWRYLIGATEREVLNLPDLAPGESTDDLAVPQEAKWLIGFWLNRGSAQPKRSATAWSSRTERQQLVWSARARRRIANDLAGIRGWTIKQASYEEAPIMPDATYFIDPPYVDKGRYYRHHTIDYPALAAWAHTLPGRVIVCEQRTADWLPFEPLASIKSSTGRSDEAVYILGSRPEQLRLDLL